MDERISFHSEDYGAPPSQSLIDALGHSPRTKLAIFISLLVIALAHWKSSLQKWYRRLKFQLKYISIMDYLVDLWWTSIEYGRGAWYIGHELLRNTLFILRGVSDDSRRNDEYLGSLANQNGHRASMPGLLDDNQLSESLEEATAVPKAHPSLDERHSIPNGGKRVFNQIIQTVEEKQTRYGEVEPAFCQETNYPPGWLVFHSRLGVVQKSVADEYDRRRNHAVSEGTDATRTKSHVVASSPYDLQSPIVGKIAPSPRSANGRGHSSPRRHLT